MRLPRLLLAGLLLGACAEPRQAREDDSGTLPPLTDRAAWRERVGWSDDCEEGHAAVPPSEGSGVRTYPLGEGRHLVEVECTRGAYQSGYVYALYDPRSTPARATPLRFPIHDGERWTMEPEIAGTPTFDPERRELEVFSKSRGIGDCGQLIRYGFPESGPELLWVRARDCDDAPREDSVPPPEAWPLVPLSALPAR